MKGTCAYRVLPEPGRAWQVFPRAVALCERRREDFTREPLARSPAERAEEGARVHRASALTHRGAGHCGVDRGLHLLPAIAQVADTDAMHALLGWCQKDSKRTDEPWVHRFLAAHFELAIRAWAFQVQIMQQLRFPRWDLIRMVCSEDCKRWRERGEIGGVREGGKETEEAHTRVMRIRARLLL